MALTKVNLANTVEGILPVANGGTGTSTGVAPGGSTTQVQFNNAGVFGGDSGFVYTGGSVGIGTTSPQQKLVVSNGGAEGLEISPTAIGSGSALISYNRSGAAYTSLTAAASYHAWQIGSTEKMRINSSGNVGIGTSSPTLASASYTGLEIYGNTLGPNIKLTNSTTGSGVSNGFDILVAAGASEAYLYQRENAAIIVGTNDTERLRITAAGGVSFGTSGTAYGSSGQVLTSNGNAAPTWNSPAASGVTSVATGNGLSGGTITTTGTLVVACPTENSVGSYASLVFYFPNGTTGPTFGANYACGSGNRQLQIGAARQGEGETGSLEYTTGSVSGTWKWLGFPSPGTNTGGWIRLCATACRVS